MKSLRQDAEICPIHKLSKLLINQIIQAYISPVCYITFYVTSCTVVFRKISFIWILSV